MKKTKKKIAFIKKVPEKRKELKEKVSKAKTKIEIEEVEANPILQEPEEKTETEETQQPEIEEKKEVSQKSEDALNQAYYDFAESVHSTIYKKLLRLQVEKESFDKLNRSGGKVWKKLDKWGWIDKYADYVVYGITTLEILTEGFIEKRKQKIKETKPKEKEAEKVGQETPLSALSGK